MLMMCILLVAELDSRGLPPPRGSITFRALTQGLQSLALGLTLVAATQLVERSRLMQLNFPALVSSRLGDFQI